VLPAALIWAEEHGALRVPRPRLRGLRPRPAQTDTS
jgi:hypothetical protein